jgi:4-methoxybenzoate monooxygenase (O-demethylating)
VTETLREQELPIFADDPYSDAVLTDPYPFFERMRAAGPAVWLEKYQVHAFGRHADCRAILDDHGTFISGAGVGPTDLRREPNWRPQGILESDPPRHTAMRAAMAGVVSPRGVKALQAGFEDFAAELLPGLLERGEIDGVRDLAEVFPIRVFGDAVGIPREGRAENLLAHGAMNFSHFGPHDARHDVFFERGEGTPEWVMERTRRANLSPDGLGARLWTYFDDGTITEEMAPLVVRALLSAGLDTTVIGIGNALKLFAEHPDQWDLVRANPRRVRSVINEVLRYESPFQSFYRTTAVDTEISGVRLAAGSKVALFLGSANRDTAEFGPDADRFRVERNAGNMIAFGSGIHLCVGQPITRLEMQIVLEWLARNVARIEFTGEPVPFLHNTLRGWSSLPLRLVPA